MRLGLFSTMAALLACSGLALGQAPDTAAPGQPIGIPKSMPAASPRSGPATMVVQGQPAPTAAPAGLPPGQPTAVPAGPYGPLYEGGDLAIPPAPGGAPLYPVYPWQQDKAWVQGEYLLWRFGSIVLPAFQAQVAAGSAVVFSRQVTVNNGVVQLVGGTIDQTINVPVSVTVNTALPGGQSVDLRDQPGFRVSGGMWLEQDQCIGIDGNFFWLWNRNVVGTNTINLPGQTAQLPSQFNQTLTVTTTSGTNSTTNQITTPVFLSANVVNAVVSANSNQIWGAELNARSRVCYIGPITLDLIGGFRYIQINQQSTDAQGLVLSPTPGTGQGGVTFSNDGTFTPSPSNPPTPPNLFPSTATLLGTFTATILDQIRTQNDYYLAQIGGSFDWQICGGRFFVVGYGKIGIGGVRERATLTGISQTTFTPSAATMNPPPFVQSIVGGLIVSPSDNGRTEFSDRVAFVPEMNLSLGYLVCGGLRVLAGYNAIYFSTVAKVGNVVSQTSTTTSVNFGQTTSNNTFVQPGFRFAGGHGTTLQGLTLGLEYQY